MKYANVKCNDVANAPGISVSIYLQGCPHHCKGCFNPETWDFNSGQELTEKMVDNIVNSINLNNVQRNLCILGGEPLCDQNIPTTLFIIKKTKEKFPNTPIYIWSGYLLEDLLKKDNKNLKEILNSIDFLIDGPFIEELKDLSLVMRGSSNQRIFNMKKIDILKKL